jgi:hypothetical protein
MHGLIPKGKRLPRRLTLRAEAPLQPHPEEPPKAAYRSLILRRAEGLSRRMMGCHTQPAGGAGEKPSLSRRVPN